MKEEQESVQNVWSILELVRPSEAVFKPLSQGI